MQGHGRLTRALITKFPALSALKSPVLTLAVAAVYPDLSSGFLNLRVRDIARAYRDWSARGATFLTEPKNHGHEIRAYIRDPDGHLIEVGQTT
jgi:catechol 2,3-dioxygenase-like lactoylglutathione lyase family enzyme